MRPVHVRAVRKPAQLQFELRGRVCVVCVRLCAYACVHFCVCAAVCLCVCVCVRVRFCVRAAAVWVGGEVAHSASRTR